MRNRQPRLLGVPTRSTRSRSRAAAQRFARCHASLSEYGAQRLEATGWNTLGYGARLAAYPGFRQLATPLARVWATYDEIDALGETIAEIALGPRGWLDATDRSMASAATSSDFSLYTVIERSQAGIRLRCAYSGTSVMVHASLSEARFIPGQHMVARVVSIAGLGMLVAAAYVRAFDVRESTGRRRGRETLRHALRTFSDVQLSRSPLEPHMVGWAVGDMLALDGELRRVERALSTTGATQVHVDDGRRRIRCLRRTGGWLITDEHCSIERVRSDHCHPLDVELFRQCGIAPNGAIPQVIGIRTEVMQLCANAAKMLATRRAA